MGISVLSFIWNNHPFRESIQCRTRKAYNFILHYAVGLRCQTLCTLYTLYYDTINKKRKGTLINNPYYWHRYHRTTKLIISFNEFQSILNVVKSRQFELMVHLFSKYIGVVVQKSHYEQCYLRCEAWNQLKLNQILIFLKLIKDGVLFPERSKYHFSKC